MNILIIHSPRSGSTNLMKALGKGLNLKISNEPWMGWYDCNVDYKKIENDIIVKTSPIDKPNDYTGTHISFLKYLVTKFDKVILLSRKNKENQLDSFTFGEEYSNGNWHVNYNLDSVDKVEFKKYKKKWNRYLASINDFIIFLSTELGIDITYYEDLYYGDSDDIEYFISKNNLSTINSEEFKKQLSKKYKYRK